MSEEPQQGNIHRFRDSSELPACTVAHCRQAHFLFWIYPFRPRPCRNVVTAAAGAASYSRFPRGSRERTEERALPALSRKSTQKGVECATADFPNFAAELL
jgi:hypothetical protein